MSETLFERLRGDHRLVLERVAVIEAAVTGCRSGDRLAPETERGLLELLGLLERQFATHLRIEEDDLYPVLVAALPETRTSVGPLSAEHAELRGMLASLLALVARPGSVERDEQIVVQVRDLTDLLSIHIRKEEAVVFSIAERMLGAAELARLGAMPTGLDTSAPSPRPARADSKGIHP